jgi:hypothetical protein
MKRTILFWLCLLLAGSESYAQTTLFTYGSTWKYLDNGSDQGTAWRSLAYDESAWNTGNGKFGYGLPGLSTVVSFGPNSSQKYITTYFRKTISITNPAIFTTFTAGVLRDDGIVVYVNGVEVYRNRMKNGTVTYQTFGQDADDNASVTQTFNINKSFFVSGNNVIAVEIHQKTVTNADLGFDMQLSAEGAVLDLSPPFVMSINRQSPVPPLTIDSTLKYRVTFSEKAREVHANDFTLTTVSGTATGELRDSSVVAVNTDSLAYDVTAYAVQPTGVLRLDLNGSGTGITDTADNAITSGFTNGETYTVEASGGPVVTSINRQLPASEVTDTNAVTFRVVFSKKVRGVNAADFIITTSGGNVRGTLTKIAQEATSTILTDAVQLVPGTDSTTWDVTVRAISGSGNLRLDVKPDNNGIVDVSGNELFGGFTGGQSYTLNVAATQGFISLTDIDPISISTTTREIPQGKVWKYDGKWWTILSTSAGTKVFRLDASGWTDALTLVTSTNARADCRVVGNLVHTILYRGANTNSYFVSLEYDTVQHNYKRWTQRTSNVNIVFESGTLTTTLDVDTTNRLWMASNSNGNILVRHSDPPYSTWSAPVVIASGITSNDMCAITAMAPGKIGVFWSNQNVKRFGFRTHNDGDEPTEWSVSEVPAAQSALVQGNGMADDYMNIIPGSDGTLYCAVKTGYDKNGLPNISLLVRRPNGAWDDLYPVTSSKEGNRPVVVLNEAFGKIRVIYSVHLDNFDNTRSSDLLYRESSLSSIAFGTPMTLMSGRGVNRYEYATSTHQAYNPDIFIMATVEDASPLNTVGVIAADPASETITRAAPPSKAPVLNMEKSGRLELSGEAIATTNNLKAMVLARPNPFTNSTTVDFSLTQTGRYTVTLYDLTGRMVRVIKQGFAEAGIRNFVRIDGAQLPNGLYQVNIQTDKQVRTLKLLKY